MPSKQAVAKSLFVSLVLLGSSVISISRIASNFKNYSGKSNFKNPSYRLFKQFVGIIHTWSVLGEKISSESTIKNVCVGNEWYTFPSQFFLGDSVRLQFYEDEFRGVLPQPFASINGTWAEPLLPFNDMNREERSRYVDLAFCDYIVITRDLIESEIKISPQKRRALKDYKLFFSDKIIQPSRSPMLTRAFFIPILSHNRNAYLEYSILQKAHI